MDNGLNIAFIKLKAICDSLATNPTKDKLCDLESCVNSFPNKIIQTLHEFLLFPFYLCLHSENLRNDSELKLVLFKTLQSIFQKIKLEKIKIFTRLHIALVQQIFDNDSPTLVKNLDEDLKLSIISCLELLFKNATEELFFDLYDKENCFQLPQTCQVCMQVAKNEKYRVLRIKAIECIMAIAYVHDESNIKNEELRKKVAGMFSFVLPGITIGLLDVAKGDIKQGHRVTSLAVKALNRLIILHMQDDKLMETSNIVFEYPTKESDDTCEELATSKSKDIKSLDDMKKKFESIRNKQWYKETSSKLKTLLDMLNLQNHDHPKVRYEMAEMCRDIILLCPRNMTDSISNLLDILISLSEDTDPEVQKMSKNALSKIFDDSNNLSISAEDIVQENLYNVLTSFPRIMNETDLTKKINILNLLIGYLRIMKHNLEIVLQSPNHLRRLLLSLVHVAQLERTNISLLEEHAIRDFEVEAQGSVTWKQFTYLNEQNLLVKFQQILKLISETRAIEIVIDHLCDLFEHGENRNEVIYLLNELILGNFIEAETQINIIQRIFSMYTEENNWFLDLNITNSENRDNLNEENVTLLTVHNNIIQICLLVEGIGNMAIALQENFKPFLFKALYIILERAGSAQPLISASGFLTLNNISKSCGYKSVTNLIVDNTDYFSFHVTQKLKRLEQNPSVLEVLNVVMVYSTIDVLPSIMDIVNRVLLQSCDKFQQHNATLFLKVFLSFIKSLIRWFEIDMNPIDYHTKLLIEYKKTMDDLYSLYTFNINENFSENKEPIPEKLTEDHFKRNIDDIEDFSVENSESKKEPPEHIKLAVAVLKRSLNFLPNKDRQRKLLVLEILKFGVKVISDWEDELLPIVHLIWSPFVGRFKEVSDSLIVNKSFELLVVLANTSKNFIRHRTSKSVFKDICSNLRNLSKQSYLKDRGSAYRYTQDYKLQLNLLKNLAELITDLEMSYEDVKIAMDCASPYLSNKQPKPLQELALHFYKTLALYDFDSVWLFLIEIYGSKKSRENRTIKNDNEQNVETILKKLNLAKW